MKLSVWVNEVFNNPREYFETLIRFLKRALAKIDFRKNYSGEEKLVSMPLLFAKKILAVPSREKCTRLLGSDLSKIYDNRPMTALAIITKRSTHWCVVCRQ